MHVGLADRRDQPLRGLLRIEDGVVDADAEIRTDRAIGCEMICRSERV